MQLPLEQEFLKRRKGTLQTRADALCAEIGEARGAALVAEANRIIRHAAQLALEMQRNGIPLVQSYDRAVPIVGPTSKQSRKYNAAREPRPPALLDLAFLDALDEQDSEAQGGA